MTPEEKVQQRRKHLENVLGDKQEPPKHKFVQSFKHLIGMLNKIIASYEGHELAHLIETDARFYYDLVYTQPYCDDYVWKVDKEREIRLLIGKELLGEYLKYEKTMIFCGKSYDKTKKAIVVPKDLYDK